MSRDDLGVHLRLLDPLSMADRRLYDRAVLALRLWWLPLPAIGRAPRLVAVEEARGQDAVCELSPSGMAGAVAGDWQVGDRGLMLLRPGARDLRVVARVVRVEERQVAFAFEEADVDLRHELALLVDEVVLGLSP